MSDEHLIQIAGFFLGDGFWLGGRVAFSNTNEDLINHYKKIIFKLGYKSKLYKRKKIGNRKDEFTLVAEKDFSNKIKEELKRINRTAENLDSAKAFLRGLFDAEGTVSFSSTRRGREIKITNTDEEIILLARICFTKLKIKNTIGIAKGYRPNRKRCYNIKTYGESSLKFIQKIKPYKIFSKDYLQGKVHPKYLYLFK